LDDEGLARAGAGFFKGFDMSKKRAATQKRLRVCDHQLVRKAYYLGLPGDGYVCVSCGESGDTPDWPDRKQPLKTTIH